MCLTQRYLPRDVFVTVVVEDKRFGIETKEKANKKTKQMAYIKLLARDLSFS